MNLISEFGVGIYEKALPDSLSLADKLREAKKAGFSHIEMCIDENESRLSRLDWSASQINEIRRETEQEDFRIRSIALSASRKYPIGSKDREIRNRGIEITKKTVEIAEALGSRVILIAGYDDYYGPRDDDTRSMFVDNLASVSAFAASHGVMLALENVDTDFLDSAEKTSRVVRDINNPYLRLYLDIGNLYAAGADVNEDLKCAAGLIAAIHVKDAKPGIYKGVGFGDGVVDFRAFFDFLSRHVYPGIGLITAEMWSAPDYDETLFNMQKASDFLSWFNLDI